MSSALPLIGTLASKTVLQRFRKDQAIDCRFTGEESGFALVLAVREDAPHGHAAAYTGKRQRGVRGNASIVLLRFHVRCQVRAYLPIGYQKAGGNSRERHQPIR